MRFSDPRYLLFALVALLCLAQGVAAVGGGPAGSAAVDGADAMAQETPTPTNNSSVQQENPEEVDEEGDTDAVRSHLAQQLADRLGESSVEISQGEYEQGQSVLGDEYDSVLEQYVDVAGGTDDDSEAESFEETQENQREYGDLLQEYNETYAAYQDAREAGNTSRARELARELDRLATRIEQSGGNVTRSYTRVENASETDLSNATRQIENTSRGIEQQQATVVEETFVRTALSVRTDASTVSFDAPARVEGRITLENGTALSNETVRLRIGERTRSVTTDENGSFAAEYRPVRAPADAEAVSISYRPATESVYLGSNASLDVEVAPTTADLTVERDRSAAAFGDAVTVTGAATVDGTPVPGASVRVSVDGATLGTVRTGGNGNYSMTTTLPASIPADDATIEATIVPADRAVRSETATAPLRVESTETTLDLNGTDVTAEGVRIAGVLRTADGRSLAGESVELRFAGSTVATVETDEDGRFERTVSVEADRTGAVSVAAVYDESATNLEGATAERQVDLGDEATTGDQFPTNPALFVGGGVLVVGMVVGGWMLRRGRGGEAPGEPAGASTTAGTGTREGAVAASGTDAAGLRDRAAEELAAGSPDRAVRALYAAARRSVSGDDRRRDRTHWEFYATASDRLNGEAAGTLERLTEAYERVVYSPRSVDADAVATLLDEAEQLLDERDEDAAE